MEGLNRQERLYGRGKQTNAITLTVDGTQKGLGHAISTILGLLLIEHAICK